MDLFLSGMYNLKYQHVICVYLQCAIIEVDYYFKLEMYIFGILVQNTKYFLGSKIIGWGGGLHYGGIWHLLNSLKYET